MELRENWRTLFGAEPPPKLRASLLSQAIAYQLQEKALGGLKPVTERSLDRIADAIAIRRQVPTTHEKFRASPGALLIREWHATQHQVTALKDGFLYRKTLSFAVRNRPPGARGALY